MEILAHQFGPNYRDTDTAMQEIAGALAIVLSIEL
jgi:hypothetical protein